MQPLARAFGDVIIALPAGKQLEHLPWKKVAELVRDDGSQASLEALSEGHEQLKMTVSDLLIWLNASNIEERLEY
jgi:hypothetical protein